MARILPVLFFLAALLSRPERSFGQDPALLDERSIQVTIDYGDGETKRRDSHDGVVPPAGVAISRPVTIIVQFPMSREGQRVAIAAMDEGVVEPKTAIPIAEDGTVSFTFQADSPGLHRLMVLGPQQHEIQIYVFDPDEAPAVTR